MFCTPKIITPGKQNKSTNIFSFACVFTELEARKRIPTKSTQRSSNLPPGMAVFALGDSVTVYPAKRRRITRFPETEIVRVALEGPSTSFVNYSSLKDSIVICNEGSSRLNRLSIRGESSSIIGEDDFV
jgi:hypothetical protein